METGLFIFAEGRVEQEAKSSLALTAAPGWLSYPSFCSYVGPFTFTGAGGKQQRHLSVVCFHSVPPSFTPSVVFLRI